MSYRDTVTDQHLQRIGHALYGIVPQVYRYHSENSYVCRLGFGGALPDKVIKYARTNGRQVLREQAVLRALRQAGLPVPAVEFTQDDCAIEGSPFLIMPCMAGASLQDACESGAAWARAALAQAGRFSARLGALPPEVLVAGRGQQATAAVQVEAPPIARRAPPIRQWALAGDLGGDETRLVESHLRRIDRMLDETSSLVHGSYSPAHILCAAAGSFAVIDWENAGGGSVLRDVGHFLAALEV